MIPAVQSNFLNDYIAFFRAYLETIQKALSVTCEEIPPKPKLSPCAVIREQSATDPNRDRLIPGVSCDNTEGFEISPPKPTTVSSIEDLIFGK